MKKIPYAKPSITDLEIEYANDAVRNGWGDNHNNYIVRFEKALALHLGVKHAIATSSCTGALTIGMAALGIGKGDEVILADSNWIAVAAPIVHLGATPVFVDIDPVSWCIDPVKVERAISAHTKAIIACHLYGNLCDMDWLRYLGKEYGIPVIEDAAEALGSVWNGQRAGSMGKFGTWSLHGTKTIITGEGGVLFINDPCLYDTALSLSNHGRTRYQTKQFWPEMVGFKYKMSNIQAAIGCAQLQRIDELVARKREITAYYTSRLLAPGITMNVEPGGTINGCWMPVVVFDKELGVTREKLVKAFSKANISARVFFYPLSSLPMFKKRNNKVAYDIPTRAINLPSFHDITTEEMDRVVEVVRKVKG
jgi:perosamine synthetase